MAVIDGVLGVEREIAAYIPQVKRTVEGAVAYVKISDGCNRFCSFCMIPYIRGRYHSRNAESIISEVRDLVAGWDVAADFIHRTLKPHQIGRAHV